MAISGVTRRSFLAGLMLAAGELYAQPVQRGARKAAIPAQPEGEHLLWYDAPAKGWGEALPIGNGRAGAMLLGGERTHRLLLNEESFWSGGPRDFKPQDGSKYINMLYSLLLAENGPRADQVVRERLLSRVGESYQPLGFLTVEDHSPAGALNCRRSLDLRDGVCDVTTVSADGGSFHLSSFASVPDQVLVIELRGEAAALHCAARLGSAQRGSARVSGDVLLLEVHAPVHVVDGDVDNANGAVTWGDSADGRGLQGTVAVCVLEQTGGTRSCSAEGIRIEGAASATLLLAMRTSYAGAQQSPGGQQHEATTRALRDLQLARAQQTTQQLVERHLADHRALFDRVELRLGTEAGHAEPVPLPTDVRLASFATGQPDPGLAVLYFNLARYLLMASSRPGTLPATTQGIWTHEERAHGKVAWALDGELAVSYWLAQSGDLPECQDPVFQLAGQLAKDGAHTAKRLYGVPGWVAHTQADLWGSTLPDADKSEAAIWKCGAAWLCLQGWDAYRFSGDLGFLAQQYGRMREASLFFVEHMRADREGWLGAFPEASSGRGYRLPDGSAAFTSFSPAMNSAIVRELLTCTATAAALLNRDAVLAERLIAAAGQLRPPAANPHTGELLEWPDPAAYAQDPQGASIPQLWPLMPGTQLDRESTPELADAAHRTMVNRAPWQVQPGGATAGWCASALARLGDDAAAYQVLCAHLRQGVEPNLLAHDREAGSSFVMAGNLGMGAAIAEMLLQSHAAEIHFLPALPKAWSTGSFAGLRARGGWKAALEWHSGRATHARLTATAEPAADVILRAPAGQSIRAVLNSRDFSRLGADRVKFRARQGESYGVFFS